MIILILESVIIALFFLGNSILVQSNAGLKKAYIDNFTGDAMIKVPTDLPVSIFGAFTPSIGEYFTIPELPDIEKLRNLVGQNSAVQDSIPLLSGLSEMRVDKYQKAIALFGIDPDHYFDFFEGLQLIEGESLVDSRGFFITEARVEQINSQLGRSITIGEPILLTSYSEGSFKIRELPLAGILRYAHSSRALDEVALVDAQTLRELNSVSLSVDSDYRADGAEISLLESDFDALFGASDFSFDKEQEVEDNGSVFDNLSGRMAEGNSAPVDLASGGWHFLLVRFRDGVNPGSALKSLNRQIESENLEAVNWRDAAGLSALLVVLLRIVFNGGFILVLCAGVIAIVNILVISVIERTGEIGTLRAIGASRSYVRKLLSLENLILALLSAFLGILIASVILFASNTAEITLSNSLLKSLFSNTVLNVNFSVYVAFWSLGVALVLAVISSWFPITMALRIQPMRAILQD